MAVKQTTLYLEHVRSFAEPQSVPLRPLTLLVGENSSGKSTFLAVAACVFGDHSLSRPGLNEPPFNLGTFETIATFKGGQYGRDESFTVGFSTAEDGSPHYRDVKATYRRDRGGPGLMRFEGRSSRGRIALQVEGERVSGEAIVAAEGNSPEEKLHLKDSPGALTLIQESFSLENLAPILLTAFSDQGGSRQRPLFDRLLRLGRSFQSPFGSVASFAPIRTKPSRTYDELSEDYSPEGDHVPKVLARLLNEEFSSATAKQLRESLQRFGEESGLFREIGVKKLGKRPDDPFQVQVTVGGPKVNLVDVGYGVSQALPVIVQSVIRKENSLLLIQQPEVHLHPRAQAALGTFFAELVALGQEAILVETHSDFLVDRVRQEVAKGTLKPEQVQVLFFDRPKMETIVYPVEFDEQGNVEGAPECYRAFFLEEQVRLLRRAGV